METCFAKKVDNVVLGSATKCPDSGLIGPISGFLRHCSRRPVTDDPESDIREAFPRPLENRNTRFLGQATDKEGAAGVFEHEDLGSG